MKPQLNAPYNLLAIIGPTASGKTTFAAMLASDIDGEIISGDSRQIYRGMDIGTGKDLAEYTVEDKPVPYHLIDIADAGYKYSVYEYQRDFIPVFEAIVNKGKWPVLCGGTGLYIEAVLKGYKLVQVPKNEALRDQLKHKSLSELEEILARYKPLHNSTDTDTVRRAIRAIEIADYYANNVLDAADYPVLKPLIIGIRIDREERREKITRRLTDRLKNGMIDEVNALLKRGLEPDNLIYYGLEYKFITQYVIGEITYDEMFNALEIAIHQFAKRQMTWFRGMERRGFTIHWMEAGMPVDQKLNAVKKWLYGGI